MSFSTQRQSSCCIQRPAAFGLSRKKQTLCSEEAANRVPNMFTLDSPSLLHEEKKTKTSISFHASLWKWSQMKLGPIDE